MGFGLYIHIPFCKKKCLYCDFYSQAESEEVPNTYVDSLLLALKTHRPYFLDGAAQRPTSLYFGGGTPGLLSAGQVKRMVEAANPLPGAEITIELNPESTCKKKLGGFLEAGVNRVSFGVQTARDDSLRRLGRLHTAKEAKRALQDASDVGFQNISGDLMLALPHYSKEEFCESLQLLQEGGVCHISTYLLKVEEGTSFGQNLPSGLPDEDETADFYLFAVDQLNVAGFARYEISNFAKPNCESRHNMLYWNCEDYLGVGPAAHSCLDGRRFSFVSDIGRFIRENAPTQEEGSLTPEDYLMLRLRLEAGFLEDEWHRRFGRRLSKTQREKLAFFEQKGLCIKSQKGWALTSSGFLVQNTLLAELVDEA